ncbi:MAG: hypothetical protein KJZ87_29120, partial [Thermoguttaceae bacterium]|nr:hypothetical protein [Thermoguttaceae bacterium]
MRGIAWTCGTVLMVWAIGATAVAAEQSEPVKQRDLAVAIVADPQLQVNTGGHTAAVRAVDFSPDSARLFTGGLDKTVQVWNLTAITRDLRVSVLRERTIRWQIGRGPRGSIHALAVAPSDGLVAIGGYGAMGSSGEILLVDSGNGRLARVLQSHERPISSLAFSADGNWLASADLGGKVVLWKQPDWAPTVLYAGDETVYGRDQARQIAAEEPQRPVVFLGSSHVVVPVYVGQHSSGRAQWQLQHIRVDRPADHRTSATVHYGMVTALAADRTGTWLASADDAGHVHLTQTTSGQTTPFPCPSNACSLALSRDARTLAVGTVIAGPHAEIQVWDVPTRRIIRRRPLPDHVLACAISPDGARIA